MNVDVLGLDYIPTWLLSQVDCAPTNHVLGIAKVSMEYDFFRNKKVWENKIVNAVVAMDWSSKVITEGRKAKDKKVFQTKTNASITFQMPPKWDCPEPGVLKLNVDAAYRQRANSFSIGWLFVITVTLTKHYELSSNYFRKLKVIYESKSYMSNIIF